MNENSPFELGQMVYLRADSARRGPVVRRLPAVGGKARYSVYHGPSDTSAYYEDQLAALEESGGDDFSQTLQSGPWLDAASFWARLTARRLAHPLTDSLYALKAARIQSIPFQFKPLLRFVRADRPRILISDDVGVGKTIEAGLILKELETRQDLANVLVVCPKALVSKWRAEMRRFDEQFRELTPENLRYCLRETAFDGAWPVQFGRAIVPLELLRNDRYVLGQDASSQRDPGLLSLNPPPQFDLLIVDEAHHLRNPETNSHVLARFLCDISEAVLFLTATPVHLGARDLYTLLNLLRPDVFRDEALFQVLVEPNRFLTEATRHLRTAAPTDSWQHDAYSQLELASQTEWGRTSLQTDPRFASWLRRLVEIEPLDDLSRIRAIRDLEEVHSLALVMNRTRRRDIGAFTVREPHTIAVSFTPQQETFYKELVEFRRRVLLLSHDPRVVRLITDTLERQASSCLPALASAIDDFFRTGRFSLGSATDVDEELDLESTVPATLLTEARELQRLARALPSDDPKRDRFLDVVTETLSGEGPRKVLVFSFFLHTIGYLEEQLRGAGCRVGVVTGRIADEERERLRERFRLPFENELALDVLVSSEVGCEGLDYEFCDRLVNYDIPWNPMRVEQRIGRIDRFGQRSDKVLIFNFITPGTVEERIFHRCFERLGVFRDTVGDLEEVLGELVQDLNRLAFDPSLSLEQAAEKAQQLADNVVRLAEERSRLEQEANTLIGVDQALDDEVSDVVAEGRFVSPDDLRALVDAFLVKPSVLGRLVKDDRNVGLYQLRIPKEGRREVSRRARGLSRMDSATAQLIRWLDGEDSALTLTFDQAVALEHRETPFVTPVHPLAKLAVEELERDRQPLVAVLSVNDSSSRPGRYLFSCESWEYLAARRETRLVGFAVDLETGEHNSDVSTKLLRLLGNATSATASTRPEIDNVFHALDEVVHAARMSEVAMLQNRNDQLLNQRIASLEAYHRQRASRVKEDLAQATESRIRRMRESEQARIERDYVRLREDLEARRSADILGSRLAAGILSIEGSPHAQ